MNRQLVLAWTALFVGAASAQAQTTISVSATGSSTLEGAPSFGVHPHPPNQRCPVGQKIEQVLVEVFSTAQTALERALKERTLAEMLETVVGTEPSP